MSIKAFLVIIGITLGLLWVQWMLHAPSPWRIQVQGASNLYDLPGAVRPRP